ncbi:TetR family transcriptional regulator C-terminal domain-containing protein [Waterburya agarophytonicola K14]|uniref:TetR family transcriptional regulator C-terminal domain-containing protein n=1 Tax=Waterburya agarophytonicola KI4 TaxID=2874699 RepID=A0A964BQ10_9CYAN|nr:TetR/AcrR family transcriptional regulator [Waterburya agarophytonicola]MCC0177285.1 TetR family transcriptional regulator C-terminal domain-containing protein [Waterburya agarophytonicola KI4]
MKRTKKRDLLIQVGSQIVVQQGFKAASINAILIAAGVPKGSFYYYFASKEDFGLAIIEDFAQQYQNKLEKTLKNEQFPSLTRLRNFFELGIAEMKNCHCTNGCLMGNLAQELSAQNELFRDRISQVFADWELRLIECLESAEEAGEVKSGRDLANLAKFVLSSWEGAILQAKVTKSVMPMENFVNILFEQILIID